VSADCDGGGGGDNGISKMPHPTLQHTKKTTKKMPRPAGHFPYTHMCIFIYIYIYTDSGKGGNKGAEQNLGDV